MSRGQICLVLSAIAAAAVACGDNQRAALSARSGGGPMQPPGGSAISGVGGRDGGPTAATGSGGTAGTGNTAGRAPSVHSHSTPARARMSSPTIS